MIVLALSAVLSLHQKSGPSPSRFQNASPLPLPPVKIDLELQRGLGVATQTARALNLQARILWIDATANLDRINSTEKIIDLVKKVKESGFNTIVLDVKPISGQTLYPSKIAPRLLEWRGKSMPAQFDPVQVFVTEAHGQGLSLFTSLNAFSEGHNLLKVGPGYNKPDWQSVLYVADPVVQSSTGIRFPLNLGGKGDSDKELRFYTNPKDLPTPTSGAFAVTVTKRRIVQDGFENGGFERIPLALPSGGYILYGTGPAAEFLRANALPGTNLQLATDPKFVPSGERPDDQYPLMMNPNSLEVQDYELSILREVLTNYAVDGVLYDDRFRYSGIHADFSPTSRRLFEAEVGKALTWPDDVFRFTIGNAQGRGIEPGPYFDQWMSWRALQLRKYLNRVRGVAKLARPEVQVGLYAGSWYGEYPALGSNWGSDRFDGGFWFLTSDYKKTGLAPMLDFLITGCYYPTATIFDALSTGVGIGGTVEAAGILSNRAVRDQTWAYAGIALSQFKGNPEGLSDALQAACATSKGVMVFDLSHDIEPMWALFQKAFRDPMRAPHQIPNLLTGVREKRAKLDKANRPDPIVILTAGSSGTGQ